MESIEEGRGGYPEEQPGEVVPDDDDSTAREGASTSDADRAPHNDDGTATGNPDSAG